MMAKILIVEDDVDLCATYVDLLESMGHEVTAIHNSHQAVERLIQGRMKPDVVVLDMNLHGDSGLVVLGLIRRMPRLARTKVVIASGYPDLAHRAMAEWGADLFLRKPVSIAHLKNTVESFTVTLAN
jgi:CheY-like chemotaxis protein